MYSFERFNSWMCRRALNRAFPEATVMETYHVMFYDACVLNKFNHPEWELLVDLMYD